MVTIASQAHSPRLIVGKNWNYRAGAGLGINQSHMIGVWLLHTNTLSSVISRCNLICELADDPTAGSNTDAPMELPDLCLLLAKTLAAIQRYAKIPTDRNAHFNMKADHGGGSWRIFIALPTFAPRATLLSMKWLWHILNTAELSADGLETEFFCIQQDIRTYGIQGENQWRIIQAALDDGLPVSYIASGFVILGSGRNGRLFHSFTTDKTSYLGVSLAQNKHVTAHILRAAGLPGAVNVLVHSANEAEMQAIKIGFPVVVKPSDKDRGVGVASDLVSVADVRAAFDEARRVSSSVLVEKYQPGFTHRLTVIDGQVMRVTKHVAFGVYGDGIHSVAWLVDQLGHELNQRKRTQRTNHLTFTIDDEANSLLMQRGLDPTYVPQHGEYVRLRRRDNISVGGVRYTLALEDIHPDNMELAVRATKRLNLDIAGIDLITENIGVSWLNSKVTICEVNAKPQVVARDNPEMYKIILRKMFDGGLRVQARLHVVSETIRAGFLESCGRLHPKTLVSDKSGVWLGNHRLTQTFNNGFEAAKAIVTDGSAAAMICILSPEEVSEFGLPLEKWDNIYIHIPDILAPPQDKNQTLINLRAILTPHCSNQLKFIKATNP